MPERTDVFDSFQDLIIARPSVSPWSIAEDGQTAYHPDHDLLASLLQVPLGEGRGSESGRLAKSIDAWVACELRRAGFPQDEVWPRVHKPRVLPREVGMLVDSLPRQLKVAVQEQLLRNKQVAPTDGRVLGRAYVKQVDVLVAQWSRGPEVLISTKSMVSSFRNNLANRFEESYGDAKNLKGRFPLASMGFLFLLRSTVLTESGTLERAIDMLRKLQDDSDVYDSTCLVVAEWNDDPFAGVQLRTDVVPPDLTTATFLTKIIDCVLQRTPIDMHVEVRSRREHRTLPLDELSEPDEP